MPYAFGLRAKISFVASLLLVFFVSSFMSFSLFNSCNQIFCINLENRRLVDQVGCFFLWDSEGKIRIFFLQCPVTLVRVICKLDARNTRDVKDEDFVYGNAICSVQWPTIDWIFVNISMVNIISIVAKHFCHN